MVRHKRILWESEKGEWGLKYKQSYYILKGGRNIMPIAKTYENAELASIIPFTEDKHWYLKLIYTYEDKKGKHMIVSY